MNPPVLPQKVKNVGGQVLEDLFFEFIEGKYNISKDELLKLIEDKRSTRDIVDGIPVSILNSTVLSSLEAIVKFLRENRDLSYNIIGEKLSRNPKTLAVTYAVARRKMPEMFAKNIENDVNIIPFITFSDKLSILESVCVYLKSQNNSYADIARMLNKDQRTIWTVCMRAEKKSHGHVKGKKHGR
jgi:hypothetical protein